MRPLTYISLFSSAGIGCYGFKEQNFKCISTCEYLHKRMNIQRYNKKCDLQSGYIEGDITLLSIHKRIFEEINKHEGKSVDVVVATPPCQGMSIANRKKGDEVKRNSLVVESIKLVREIKPKVFIFENVKAFLGTICTDVDGKEKAISEAIEGNLLNSYNIDSRVINFKEYGANSSRTRTLVIGVRKDLKVSPSSLFPEKKVAPTLEELIADLPSLKVMGAISEDDIYHAYRSFERRMLPWIEKLGEGEGAFNNVESKRIPHKIVEGKRVPLKNSNAHKYSRWYWDRVAPCIHTRNDTLSSQSTIHPQDNRVFSIRELRRMMNIPSSFKFSALSERELNDLCIESKKKFLKQEELTIRHAIGEAVPTSIFSAIAKKIREKFN